jgi:hypothetical protein
VSGEKSVSVCLWVGGQGRAVRTYRAARLTRREHSMFAGKAEREREREQERVREREREREPRE